MKVETSLEDLGFNRKYEEFRIRQELDGLQMGRVIAEHRERYIVKTIQAEIEAEITGNMRFSATSREDFPAVGDWVSLATYDSGPAIIHQIFPRDSMIKRKAAGQIGDIQVIATNIDYAFIIQAVDRDFNINRLERYLTICYASGVRPIVVLSKTDLAEEVRVEEIRERIKHRIEDVPVITVSSETENGYAALKELIEKGKTYCMLGSSGVGKSTLLNHLSGRTIMSTEPISQSTNKGRHVTSHRELVVLEEGGILVDNPGMREVGIADTTTGLESTFNRIISLAQQCKYKDCTHTVETGCSVLGAIEKGDLDRSSYENYLKLEREKAHFESTVEERRSRDREFGKMLKNYKKDKNKNEY